MDDAEKKARQHEPNGRFRIDRRAPPPDASTSATSSCSRPQIQNRVHAGEHVRVGREVPQRAADEERQLIGP